jgi:hypothetical protein
VGVGPDGAFAASLPFEPVRVEVDPDWHALRRVAASDLPACLNGTLEAPGEGVVVLRAPPGPVADLAERLAKEKGWRLVEPGEDLDLAAHAGPAVLLEVGASGVEPGTAVLESSREGGRWRTAYRAADAAAAERAGYVPFYGWDTRVVFQGGRPVERRTDRPEVPRTAWVASGTGGGADPARVRADVDHLAGEGLGGRRPGRAGHDAAAAWLAGALAALKEGGVLAETWTTPVATVGVGLEVRDLASPAAVEVVGAGGGRFEDALWPFSFSGEFAGERTFSLGEGAPSAEVVVWGGEDVAALHARAAEAGKDALVVVLDDAGFEALSPWLDRPSALTAASEAQIGKPGRDGKARPRPPAAPWITGRRLRADAAPLGLLGIPVVAVPASVGAALEGAEAVTFRLAFGEEQGLAAAWVQNVGARTVPQGGHGAPAGVVVLSAHYDALGREGGRLFAGADDNASGVACVLEALRLLQPHAEALREPGRLGLLVCFTDAEEWGLVGARALVKDLAEDGVTVKAVVNVDSVGRAAGKPVHVIGLGTHPDLGHAALRQLEARGLASGPDIDRYAYAHGSDHWPFHEAGIPAITVWASDYAVMNTADDVPEKVEPEGVAKIAEAVARLVLELTRAR